MNTRLHKLIHTLWTAAADAVLGPPCLRLSGWLDYWDTKLADACNGEDDE